MDTENTHQADFFHWLLACAIGVATIVFVVYAAMRPTAVPGAAGTRSSGVGTEALLFMLIG